MADEDQTARQDGLPNQSLQTPVDQTTNATPAPAGGTVDTVGRNDEQPNAALSQVDDTTFEQAGKERTDPANPDIPTTSSDQAVEMPSRVLADALEPGAVVQSAPLQDKTDAPLVVAPSLGQALEVAADNQTGGPAAVGNPANPVNDIGAGAADATVGDVAVAAPAAPKATADGTNAGAVDPTGYVAPIRVSAAGVPVTDPTVMAANVGDLNTQPTGAPGAYAANRPAATSDKPDTASPSTGVDASQASVNSRLNGNAQAQNPGTVDPSPDVKASADARVAAMTGAPLPPSGGDRTMSTPTGAGDVEAAERVAAFHTQDEPEPGAAPAEAAPAAPSDGSADPNAVATAVQAANTSGNPAPAHPDTARPIGEPLNADAPSTVVTDKVTSVPARDGSSGDPAQSGAENGSTPPADAAGSSNDEDEDIPVATNEQKVAAAEVLHQDGLIPAPVLADIKATATGPTTEDEVKDGGDDEGDVHYVEHHVMMKTTYAVRAKDSEAAVQAVKDGKGASTSVHTDEDWEGR